MNNYIDLHDYKLKMLQVGFNVYIGLVSNKNILLNKTELHYPMEVMIQAGDSKNTILFNDFLKFVSKSIIVDSNKIDLEYNPEERVKDVYFQYLTSNLGVPKPINFLRI